MCPVCAAPEKECGWTIGKFQKEKGDATMKSNKRMQALLSTAMCAAILFSNAAAVFAAEVPPLPRKEGENPQLAPAARRGVLPPIRRGCSV